MPPKTRAEKIRAVSRLAHPHPSHPTPVSAQVVYSSLDLRRSLILTGFIISLIVLFFALQKMNFIG